MAQAKEHPGSGHRERLRDKFLEHGLNKFKDDEVLELLLTLATPRRDCKRQARELLEKQGSLSAVLDAEPKALAEVKGVGPKNILGLKLIPAVASRYMTSKLLQNSGPVNRDMLVEHFRMHLLPLGKESFMAVYLDSGSRVIKSECLSEGTVNQAGVYPREVVSQALALNAAGLVCAHNHTSGEARPSRDDEALTRQLTHACCVVGLKLMDHIIVARQKTFSFADHGGIRAYENEFRQLFI
jgi:DNA repair protein RadC